MLDALLGPAQVGVGDGCPITKVQLDVGPQGVTLKHTAGQGFSQTTLLTPETFKGRPAAAALGCVQTAGPNAQLACFPVIRFFLVFTE